jgi:hypothetical protein
MTKEYSRLCAKWTAERLISDSVTRRLLLRHLTPVQARLYRFASVQESRLRDSGTLMNAGEHV